MHQVVLPDTHSRPPPLRLKHGDSCLQHVLLIVSSKKNAMPLSFCREETSGMETSQGALAMCGRFIGFCATPPVHLRNFRTPGFERFRYFETVSPRRPGIVPTGRHVGRFLLFLGVAFSGRSWAPVKKRCYPTRRESCQSCFTRHTEMAKLVAHIIGGILLNCSSDEAAHRPSRELHVQGCQHA